MDTIVPQFIDVFAGAGGLSLGLMKAGWKGLFAVEKSPMAFQTLQYNLIDKEDELQFEWPEWLPKEAIDIQTLLEKYKEQLEGLRGIALLAGGPPCQGFSSSGRRQHDDERNWLFKQYLKLVDLVKPKILLLENVQGFAKPFSRTEKGKNGKQIQNKKFNADEELQHQLIKMGYLPFRRHSVKAKDFGVPQLRPRYILIAIHEELLKYTPFPDPFNILYDSIREKFLLARGLSPDREVTLSEAISDLERANGAVECIEPGMKKFLQGIYGPFKEGNSYQNLMRRRRDEVPIEEGQVADSHRFANHTPEIEARFRRIINEFRPGIQLSSIEREKLKINKHRVAPLSPDEACHTLTSLPDDLVHYCEPRIPTVREYARIQSFPDWFKFKAKYTTGDKQRRVQVPRYTQVANAVPPLLAEAIGLALLGLLERLASPLPLGAAYATVGVIIGVSSSNYLQQEHDKVEDPVASNSLGQQALPLFSTS